ncbi:molybdopterin-dependent oxidoreductase [Novosphingobium piscinae]|uniref:Molybdopterin-dependent oxidoreductase n=1 Tax=Novosphingobium piscinae TaxID=1507448 RepID=A0A7X1FZ71_9SPHN|nr:molybdopterin-dependent oxidoreductase [Novosphingobium piscinae]MBC2669695.1 molybdopterin-dependent oxidoreductase [Novosphingobium piscinae]
MPPFDRRRLLSAAGLALVTGAGRGLARTVDLPFDNGTRPLVRLPQKREMILLTARPPQLETPFSVFNTGIITPNDAFFVRYHLSGLPTEIDPATFRLTIAGHVERPLSLSLASLKRDFPATEVVAVNQCSGNSRGFVEPRVGGGQLGNGAMGNARWRGVPLRALLDRAGIRAGAVEVTFNGLDTPPAETVPDFIKALDLDHARDGEVMVAYAMNGTDLPLLNGFPLRLVVPGYYGTYWVKHLNEITVRDSAFDGYWMKTAYRVPDTACACVAPGEKPTATRPISRMNVRSFVTSHADGARVAAGRTEVLRGIAFSGGEGVARVMVSTDGGQVWQEARLGEDLGGYSFREWQAGVVLPPGRHRVMVRATTRDGETQPLEPRWQPAGYMRNVVETVLVEAV